MVNAVHKSIYPKLAASNLRKNGRLYIPYLLAAAGTVMMFYIMVTLTRDPGIQNVDFWTDTQMILTLGCVVIAIFALILLFYTSSLLTKQRQREFGLYNVLGMEKRHVGRLLLWETLYCALITLTAGILCGILFSKLMQLLLLRLMGLSTDFRFAADPFAVLLSLILFGVIFLLIALNTLRIVYRSNPIELLRSASAGEREPKTKWLAALLGLICLGAGYYLALKVDDYVGAITWFFVAVLLVIAGTYLCFTAFSIVLLKALRKNKKYYYKTSHFTTVSGMLYRMKRNAAGLASICILSTMVLVTISTTTCLYLGVESINRRQFAYDITATGWFNEDYPQDRADFMGRIDTMEQVAEDYNLTIKDYACYDQLSFSAMCRGDSLVMEAHGDGFPPSVYDGEPDPDAVMLRFFVAEGYSQLTGEEIRLEKNQVLYYRDDGKRFGDTLDLFGESYTAVPLESAPIAERPWDMPVYFLVVDSAETLREIEAQELETYYNYGNSVTTTLQFNLSGTDEEKAACAEAMAEATKDPDYGYHTINDNIANRRASYAGYGSFFFIGIFLGLLFALATVLIIYYKQLSEGYDDRARFAIMQKVGMTKGEIKKTIHSQVLTVFFLPLVTAAVHITFAFPMVEKVMQAFQMTNTDLFFQCTLVTFGVFAVLYIIVYLLTARSYYRIVSAAESR